MVRACCSQKASLIVMIALTSSFFFAEIAVGYATNSMALVADSFHMLSDVVSLFVGFFALKISQQDHRKFVGKNTFGWVRAEVLGALVNSVFLAALCFSILVESLKRIVSPEGIEQPILVLAIGAAGLLVNVLGICMFQGHVGHGHTHGGHAHKKGHHHGHDHDKEVCRKVEEEINSKELVLENPSMENSNKELTTVVILDKIITNEENTNQEANNVASVESEDLGNLKNSRIHLTPSRYKMGMMLASLKVEEERADNDIAVACRSVEIEIESGSENKKMRSSDQMNIKGVYLHVLGDALGSVIVVCSALTIYFGSGKWTLYVDPVMSIIMVAIILKSSLPLLKESSLILLQTVPTHIQIQELEDKLLGKFPLIVGVHEFHVWQLAGSKIVASMHLKLPSRGDYMSISESLKSFFHEEGIHSTTIQPEFIEVFVKNRKHSPVDTQADRRQSICLLKCESVMCKDSVCCTPKAVANEEQKVTTTVEALNNRGIPTIPEMSDD